MSNIVKIEHVTVRFIAKHIVDPDQADPSEHGARYFNKSDNCTPTANPNLFGLRFLDYRALALHAQGRSI